jgi:tape measure domain-containing protein
MIGAITGVAATIGVFNTLRNAVNRAFSRIDTMEQFERTMTTMLGSADEANKALEETNAIVKGTAYGLDTAAGAVQRFVTSSVNVEDATKYVEAFGDAVAFYGDGTNEQFSRVTRAMAQMATTGKTNIGDINALLDAGIPVFEIYGDAIGITAAEARKALEGGGTDASEFLDVMTNAFQEGTDRFASIEGAAKNAGASWTGTFDNMRAAVARGVTSVIQSIDEMLTSNGLPDMRQMVANFGTTVENVLNWIATNIPIAINYFKEVYNAIKPWLPLITSVVAAFLTFNTVIGTVKSVKNAFTSAKNAVKLFNATLLANPVALVISAIVGLAIIIYTYWDEIKAFTIVTWEAIKDFFVNLWESIKERVTTVWNSIKEFFGGLWTSIVEGAISSWNIFVDSVMAIIQPFIEGVVNVFNQMKEGLITIWENIKIYFENIWEIIKNIFLGAVLLLINLVTGNFEELKNNAIQIWNNIKNALKDIWDNLKNDAIQIWNNIKAWIQDTWENIKSTIKDAVKSVKETIKTAWENVKSNTKTALENVKTTITSIWESIKTFFTETLFDIWNSVKQKFQDIVNSVREKMKETKQKIVDGWNEAKSFLTNIDLKQIGKDIIQGLIKGIKSKVKAVADAVKDVADQITGKIKSILGIKSPSRVMRDQVGKWIPEGVAVGIEKNSKSAFRSMEGLSNGLYNAFDFKMPQIDIAGSVGSLNVNRSYTGSNVMNPRTNGITQNITIVSPEPTSPSENARKFKQVARQLALEW